jgi:hypothetical protein
MLDGVFLVKEASLGVEADRALPGEGKRGLSGPIELRWSGIFRYFHSDEPTKP